ncbi:MAG: hypothetical protein V4665_03565 [Patescibacteria group bacterium]
MKTINCPANRQEMPAFWRNYFATQKKLGKITFIAEKMPVKKKIARIFRNTQTAVITIRKFDSSNRVEIKGTTIFFCITKQQAAKIKTFGLSPKSVGIHSVKATPLTETHWVTFHIMNLIKIAVSN